MVAKDGITQTEADSQTFTDFFIFLFFFCFEKRVRGDGSP